MNGCYVYTLISKPRWQKESYTQPHMKHKTLGTQLLPLVLPCTKLDTPGEKDSMFAFAPPDPSSNSLAHERASQLARFELT